MKTEILFKLSNLNSNLALALGYLNSALNNLAQGYMCTDDTDARDFGLKTPSRNQSCTRSQIERLLITK